MSPEDMPRFTLPRHGVALVALNLTDFDILTFHIFYLKRVGQRYGYTFRNSVMCERIWKCISRTVQFRDRCPRFRDINISQM